MLSNPSSLERYFLRHLHQYIPYLHGDPDFECGNLQNALPGFLAPDINKKLLTRLFEFAGRNQFGQNDRIMSTSASPKGNACQNFVEKIFPDLARRSTLGTILKLEVNVSLDIQGPDGGQWTLRWERGDLVAVEREVDLEANVIYRTDVETFTAITGGRQTPERAFFEQRLQLEGDIEMGLKLAIWLEQLLEESQAGGGQDQPCAAGDFHG